MPQDMKKSQLYGGRQICFENEEVKEMKKFDDSGLKLMGFKPASSIKRYFHIRPGQFIYPDESVSDNIYNRYLFGLYICSGKIP